VIRPRGESNTKLAASDLGLVFRPEGHQKRALDDCTDVHLVAEQSRVMDLRAPRPHLEKMAVSDFEPVYCVAVFTIDTNAVESQHGHGGIVHFDAGFDYAPSFRTREN
jgi:hypothetical protein